MPLLARWFVKTALIYLAAGVGLGGLLLMDKALGFSGWLWELRPLHIEWLFLGWTLQLALGVASWILPRASLPDRRIALGWLSFVLLNVGLILSALACLVPILVVGLKLDWLFPEAALAPVASVIILAIYLWPRIGFVPPGMLRMKS